MLKHILRRQYLNLIDAFSGKKSILTKPEIRLFSPNPVTYNMHYCVQQTMLLYVSAIGQHSVFGKHLDETSRKRQRYDCKNSSL